MSFKDPASLLVVAVIVATAKPALSFYIPESVQLRQALVQAQVIVVVKLVGFTAERPAATHGLKRVPGSAPKPLLGPDAIAAMDAMERVEPAGEYRFGVLEVLKGACPKGISVRLPAVLSRYYGGARIRVANDDLFLLLLRRDPAGILGAFDRTVPLIPLSPNCLQNNGDDSAPFDYRATGLLLSSLDDPNRRLGLVYMLRDLVDSRIPGALAPYLDDPDYRTRDFVLFCLATNEQVAAIPRIATLAEIMDAQGRGSRSPSAIRGFVTPEAIPHLNSLLLQRNYFVRLNAVTALGAPRPTMPNEPLADRTSIPYLLLELEDPDPQRLIPVSADGVLHELIPSLGPEGGDDYDSAARYFYAHRQAEIALFQSWWKNELAGEHVEKTTPGVPQTGDSELPSPTSPEAASINPLLFSPSAQVRKTAVKALGRAADRSSIPYLIVALLDPDTDLAYSAYTLLHRLIPQLGPAKERSYFETHTTEEWAPVHAWWVDELAGRHLPATDPRRRWWDAQTAGKHLSYPPTWR